MKSDTVVGIAGTVLLVAVMVGVFVYEYNNVPSDDGDEPVPSGPASLNGTLDGTLEPGGAEAVHDIELTQTASVANITVRFPNPDPVGLPGLPLPGLNLRLEGQDGVVAQGTRTVEGATVVLIIDHEGSLEPGQYRIVVGQDQGSIGADYEGTYAFYYA